MQGPSMQELINLHNSSLSPDIPWLETTFFIFWTIQIFKVTAKPCSEVGTWCKESPTAWFLTAWQGIGSSQPTDSREETVWWQQWQLKQRLLERTLHCLWNIRHPHGAIYSAGCRTKNKISTCVKTLVHRLKSFSISGNLLSLVAEKMKGDGRFFSTSGGEKARALKS